MIPKVAIAMVGELKLKVCERSGSSQFLITTQIFTTCMYFEYIHFLEKI